MTKTKFHGWLLLGLGTLGAAAPSAWAGTLDSPPILCLETGGHTAPIRALSVSKDGKLGLTASEDKTARLWDLADGRLLKTFRPTVEEGNTGKLFACALSPDGSLAALGGWTGRRQDGEHRVLLVDVRTGTCLRALKVGPEVVNHLAFSPDGRRLAVHLGGRLGLRMFHMPEGSLVASDTEFEQPSYRGAFDSQGRYAATSDDGFIRIYDPGFQRILKVPDAIGGPFGLAFSPDGALLAVGHAESPRVEVFSARDLTLAYRPTSGSGAMGIVAWSLDGETLYAAGGDDFTGESNPVRMWSRRGQGPATELPLAKATISELCPLPKGDLAFAAQDPLWGLVDASGRPRYRKAGRSTDLRAAREDFRLDAQATKATLPSGSAGRPATFSVLDLGLGKGAWDGEAAPRNLLPGIEGWKDGLHPTCKGRELELQPYEYSRCLDFLPGEAGFILGTDWWIRGFNAEGGETWRTPIAAPAWGVKLGARGTLFTAMLADGTLRWHLASNGRLLFSLFVAPDERWVLWTPTGYFATSVGGESLVGWQVNRPGELADFFPVSHFRDRFYKPELIPQLLATLDEGKALEKLGGPSAAPLPGASPLSLPPVLTITRPSDRERLPGGLTAFEILVRCPRGANPLGVLRATLDGRHIPLAGAPTLSGTRDLPDGVARSYAFKLELPARDARVGFQVELQGGQTSDWVEGDVHAAPAQAPAAAAPARAPQLRVLAVGVSKFADPSLNLGFSAKDANDVAAFFRTQEGRLFSKVDVKLLTDSTATAQAILGGLDEIRAQASPEDMSIVFFASHGGINANNNSYFLFSHDFGRGSWGVDGPDIKSRLEAIQGKVLVLMDTCHAGHVLGAGKMRDLNEFYKRTRFINELIQTGPGLVVFSASTGSQYSLESPAWNNGAFTKALREGLGGAADGAHSGCVDTAMLDAWLRQRVSEITRGQQTPVMGMSDQARAFPVALTH